MTILAGEWRFADESVVTFNISGAGASLVINDSLRAGDSGDTGWNVNMDSGVFVIGDQTEVGDDGGGIWNINGTASVSILNDFQVHLRDGGAVFELNISGDAELVVVKTLSTNDKDGGDGTAFINMNGGTVNVGENLELGDNGPGNLEVTDGLLVVGGTLELNKGDANLVGGEVRAGNLEIDTGVVMNIFEGGGLLILDGNKITQVVDLAHDGKIKAMPCDTSRIGCSGGLMVDFNVTNPGKTTLTASCAINICEPCANFPANGATEVQSGLDSGGVTLCWDEGDCLGMLGRNALYFSNDYNDVFDPPDYGIDPIYQRAGINCYNVGILELWETYYWRVDQLNQGGPTTRGPIWSFTTGCELIAGDVNMDCLVNFLDFAELASTFGEEEFWPE